MKKNPWSSCQSEKQFKKWKKFFFYTLSETKETVYNADYLINDYSFKCFQQLQGQNEKIKKHTQPSSLNPIGLHIWIKKRERKKKGR